MLQKLRCTWARGKFSKILTLGGRQLTSVRRPTGTVCPTDTLKYDSAHLELEQLAVGLSLSLQPLLQLRQLPARAGLPMVLVVVLAGCQGARHRTTDLAGGQWRHLNLSEKAQHSTARLPRGGYQTMSEPRNNWETTRVMFGKLNCLVNRIFNVW